MAIKNKHQDHLFYEQFAISRQSREQLNGHRSVLVWFTGLSRSGKSSIANGVERALHAQHYRTFILDGDNIRLGLNNDLGFTNADRMENIRRIGEVAKLFVDAGVITLCAFISPFRADREKIKNLYDDKDFIEVFCNCPLAVCEQRDVKGIYRKARAGEIKNFTGISSPYEPPSNPNLVLDTHQLTIDESVEQVIQYLKENNNIAVLKPD